MNNTNDGIVCGENSPENNANFLSKITTKCGNIIDDYFLKGNLDNDEIEKAKDDLCRILGVECRKNLKTKRLCIFLHGWGADSSLYESLCLKLCAFHDLVVSFDAFGFGMSNNVDKTLDMQDYVKALLRLVSCFEFDELSLVGHSFGGKTILFLMENNIAFDGVNLDIDKIKNVVLFAPSGVKPRFSLLKWFKVKKYKHIKKKCKSNPYYMKKLLNYGSNDYKSLNNEYMRQTFVRIVNTHISRGKLKARGRVLLVFGEKDTSTPLYMARKLLKKIGNSRLITIKGASHFLCFERPLVVSRILSEFFGNN